MKKSLILVAALALSLGVAAASFAATSATLRVLVTVQESVGISLVYGPDYGFGNLLVSSTSIAPDGRRIFRNIGAATNDWQLQCSAWSDIGGTPLSPAWTFLTDSPANPTGVNTLRLSALWLDPAVTPVVGDYAADDTLSTAAVTSNADNYARSGDPIDVKGYQVAPGTERSIFLMLQTPATTSDHLGIPNNYTTLTVTAL